MSVIVATLEGCPFGPLNDAVFLEGLLRDAVEVGGFQLLHCFTHRFDPQGVTASAVLSESHIALHAWPEDGVLFVDIATCSGEPATERAFEHICSRIPHATVRWSDTHRPALRRRQ